MNAQVSHLSKGKVFGGEEEVKKNKVKWKQCKSKDHNRKYNKAMI